MGRFYEARIAFMKQAARGLSAAWVDVAKNLRPLSSTPAYAQQAEGGECEDERFGNEFNSQ